MGPILGKVGDPTVFCILSNILLQMFSDLVLPELQLSSRMTSHMHKVSEEIQFDICCSGLLSGCP